MLARIPAAMALAGLAACSEPPAYDLRRVVFEPGPAESLTAGGVTRPGWILDSESKGASAQLADLTAGRITVHAAPAPGTIGAGGIDVVFEETGWRGYLGAGIRERCALRWGEPGSAADLPWQGCTLDLPRSVASARLEITRNAPLEGEIYVSEARLEGRAAGKSPSVFILLLDAARFDGLRPFRQDAGIGSSLEKLAADSVVFRNLRSSSSWTRPAIATLFTGLRASRHRVLDRGDVLADEVATLAEILKERGYTTAAWSTNPNVLPVWGLSQGFDVFTDQGSRSWSWGKTDGGDLVAVLRSALAARGPEPLFYYAHFMDPHAPYKPAATQLEAVEAMPGIKAAFPRPLAILSAHEHWRAFLDYTAELLDVDDHVGAVVRAIRDSGLYDDSLILVLADHGEEFIDHGGRDHGRTLYEEVLHVPALLKLPRNRLAGRQIDESLAMEDLFPTLLAAVGTEAPAGIDGVAVDFERAGEQPARPVVASLRLDARRFSSVVDLPWKLIRNDTGGGLELYNLQDDPKERKNLVLWYPQEVQRLTGALDLLMSHGQEGWHLLLCGTLVETAMDLVVTASSGTVQPFGFQPGEAVPLGNAEGGWRLSPTLTPVEVERPAFGKLAKTIVPEQLEVVVVPSGSASSLEIRSQSGDPFELRTGAGSQTRRESLFVLQADSEALATRGARMECPTEAKSGTAAAPPAEPYVRVWYVPPTQKIAVQSLDPAMQQRLRALGYLQ